ncbi:hypothetical protein EVA_14449 [gut metagenome]|uniref:Uncharacterized protein n=1 Tax=gut metagenome TaxID=749906 RepID=J9FSG6_9ZZZZ
MLSISNKSSIKFKAFKILSLQLSSVTTKLASISLRLT